MQGIPRAFSMRWWREKCGSAWGLPERWKVGLAEVALVLCMVDLSCGTIEITSPTPFSRHGGEAIDVFIAVSEWPALENSQVLAPASHS